MEGEWGGHSEIVAFSEIYSVKIHIFDSIASQEPITRVVTADGDYKISILFSGDHYDCLIPKNDDKANRNADYNVDKEDLKKNKSHADVKELIRNDNLQMTIQLNILTKHWNLSLNIWRMESILWNRRNEEKKEWNSC